MSNLTNHPLFSIIVPVHNCADYILECIDSILNQSYDAFELIIVDDGSTDESGILCDQYSNYSNVRIIHTPNRGVASARNEAICLGTGEYILFIDSDDYIIDKRLLEKLAAYTEQGYDAMIFSVVSEGRKNTPDTLPHVITEDKIDAFLIKGIVNEKINSPFGKVFRRSILNKYNISFEKSIKMGEDLLFNVEYLTKCRKLLVSGIVGYFYRTSNSNAATKKYMAGKSIDLLKVRARISNCMPNSLPKKSAIAYIRVKNDISVIFDSYRYGYVKEKNLRQRIGLINSIKSLDPAVVALHSGIMPFIITLAYRFAPALFIDFTMMIRSKL
jgi:glycosyltransferase involved in cell wall biosynthesis